jgi:hypothetical protein
LPNNFGNGNSTPSASFSYQAAVPRKSPPRDDSTVFICSMPMTSDKP